MSDHIDRFDREIARRAKGDGVFPALSFIVGDDAEAMTDVGAAAKAVIAGIAEGFDRVTISPKISDAVQAALRVSHPRRFIIRRVIVDSPLRDASRPHVASEAPEADADVMERAAARISALRSRDAS